MTLTTSVVLARRALDIGFRRPQFLAPMFIFPTLLLAVNAGGLGGATALPGFPAVNGFLDFQLAAAITQSLLLVGVTAGVATALELESGFFDRLVASPVPRPALILGRLLASAVLGVLVATWFLAIGLVFGASIEGGLPGALVVYVFSMIGGFAFAAIGVLLALRTRSASIVQGIFPLVLVVLFMSSAFFPRDLLSAPADSIADYNPLSYLADGMRNPIIADLDAQPVLEGLASAAGMAVLFTLLALHALTGRLRDG